MTVRNALVGFIEVKGPGKGADPRRFRDEHNRLHWSKLQSLPNLVFTDGNSFSLWRDGRLQGDIIRLIGDVETSGAALSAPPGLERLFGDFLRRNRLRQRTRAAWQRSVRVCADSCVMK